MLVQMDVRSVFSTIFRQIWKFLLISAPIVLIALLYVLFATPTYQSTARLLVKFGQDARPDMALAQASGLSAEERRGLVQSNANILTNRDLAEAVLKKVTVEKAYPDLARKIDDPNRALSAAVTRFGKSLLLNTESAAGVIDVALEHRDPETAKLLLNELLDLFIERQSEIFGNPQAEVIREQAGAAFSQLEEANKELFAYKQKVGIASIDEEMTLLLNKRSDIAEYLSRQEVGGPSADVAEEDVIVSEDGEVLAVPAQESKLSVLPVKKGENNNEIPFPALDQIQTRIDDLRTKELELLRTYKPSSQVVQNLRKNIDAETEVLNTAIASLYDKLSELDARIIEMNQYKADYDVLQRKVQLSEEMYKTAQTRLQAAEVNRDLNERKITQISVLEQPAVPEKPAKPKKVLTMLLAIIMAGMFGLGACLISELIDTRFSYPEQLSAHLKEPLLATFSRKKIYANGMVDTASYWEESLKGLKGLAARIMQKDIPAEDQKIETVVDRKILSARSMGTLFQSMSSQMPDSGRKVLFVASSYKEEGATTIAWELSRYITDTIKKNVLFVDYADAQKGASLLDVARGKARIEDAVTKITNGEGQLSVARLADEIESGGIVAYMDDLSKVFAGLKNNFDYVIMPASNIILEMSHLSLSRLADGTVFVIEADRTRAPVAKQALQNLKNAGAKIVGVVLNKRYYYIPKWLYSRM